MSKYGCVRCQTTHYERDPLYLPHLMFQSKHGIGRATEAEWAYARLRYRDDRLREAEAAWRREAHE